MTDKPDLELERLNSAIRTEHELRAIASAVEWLVRLLSVALIWWAAQIAFR